MDLDTGLRGSVDATVTVADTAVALGSGDVLVLGTPRVLALVEAATVAAVAGALDPGATSVGSRVELEHRAPTPVGATVRAEAELTAVAGRRLTFTVTLTEAGRVVASGTVERAVVDRTRFAASEPGPTSEPGPASEPGPTSEPGPAQASTEERG